MPSLVVSFTISLTGSAQIVRELELAALPLVSSAVILVKLDSAEEQFAAATENFVNIARFEDRVERSLQGQSVGRKRFSGSHYKLTLKNPQISSHRSWECCRAPYDRFCRLSPRKTVSAAGGIRTA